MAATPAAHTVQVHCNVRGPGQTHRAHIECVMSALLGLYILRPKQSAWIHEPAVQETFSFLRHVSSLFIFSSFDLFIPYLPRPRPPCTILPSPSPNLNSTHPLFLLFISPLHLSIFHPFHPAVSLLLPERIGESHVVCRGLRDRWWWLGFVCFHHWSGCSERVLLGWQVKCAEKWVMKPELCVLLWLRVLFLWSKDTLLSFVSILLTVEKKI